MLKQKVKNEIPSVTNLATTSALNAKINDAKNETPNVTNLAVTTALTAVKNKIPDIINVTARLAQVNLVSRNYIANFVKIQMD